MEEAKAANVAPAAGTQAPVEVSNPQIPPPLPVEPAPTSEGPSKETEKKAADEELASKEAEKKEEIPFHKRPEFQRLSRQNRRLSDRVEEQSKQLSEAVELMRQLTALQKGEEYIPQKATDESMDYDALIDREMEVLSSAEKLSPEEEDAVVQVAKEYAIESKGGKVPLPLQTALQIYRKLNVKSQVVVPPPDAPAPLKEELPVKPEAKDSPKNEEPKVLHRPGSGNPMRDMWAAIEEAKVGLRKKG